MAATCFHKTLLWLPLKSLSLFLFFSKEAAKNLLPWKGMAPPLLCHRRLRAAARRLPPRLPRSSGSATAPLLRGRCSPAPQPPPPALRAGQAPRFGTEASPNVLINLGPDDRAAANNQKFKRATWSCAESDPRELHQPHWGEQPLSACPQARFL